MKEISIEEKARRYDEVKNKLSRFIAQGVDPLITRADVQDFFPELKESEDERIRKEMLDYCYKRMNNEFSSITIHQVERWIAWLEKQVPIDEEKVLIGARKDVALSIMDFLDRNTLSMCLSNMECEDLEDAVVGSDWSKVYDYMKKKLEKQAEQNPYSGVSFKYNGHVWGMCARDNGVEILVDEEIKERVFLDNKPQGKSTLEAIKEEKVDNQNYVKSADKIEPKFHEGQWINGGIVCEDFNEGDGYYKVNLAYLSKSQVELIENLVASWQTAANNSVKWGEEDEIYLGDALWCCKQAVSIAKDDIDMESARCAEHWLKSLRQRYTWKPSEEQMRALQEAIGIVGQLTPRGECLKELVEQLKKLRED